MHFKKDVSDSSLSPIRLVVKTSCRNYEQKWIVSGLKQDKPTICTMRLLDCVASQGATNANDRGSQVEGTVGC